MLSEKFQTGSVNRASDGSLLSVCFPINIRLAAGNHADKQYALLY